MRRAMLVHKYIGVRDSIELLKKFKNEIENEINKIDKKALENGSIRGGEND